MKEEYSFGWNIFDPEYEYDWPSFLPMGDVGCGGAGRDGVESGAWMSETEIVLKGTF